MNLNGSLAATRSSVPLRVLALKRIVIIWPAHAAGKPNLQSPNLVNKDSWPQTEQSSLARLEKDEIAVAHAVQRQADVRRPKIPHDPEQLFGSRGRVLTMLETRQHLESRNHGCTC